MKSYKTIVFLILAALFLLLHVPLYEWWCDTGLGQWLGSVTPTVFNDCMALFLGLLGGVAAAMIPQRLSESGNRFARLVLGCLLFVLLVQSVSFNDCFIHAYTLPWFRYTDLLIPFLVVFLVISCMVSINESKEEGETQEENAQLMYYDDNDERDFLGRGDLVKHLCQRLEEAKGNQKCATGIAITGGWGTGKSWVLNQVKRQLKKNEEVCIDFKPWLYGETDLTRAFYLTLERQLRLNDIRVKELKQAVGEIDSEKSVGLGKAFLSVVGIVTQSNGREKTVERIKKKLKGLNRPLFVFIDDVDRLAKNELLQVLSIIRNTGDFPNVAYLMAFDRKVVEEIIGDEMGINYVGKMFNLSIDLPPMNDGVIAGFLFDAIQKKMNVGKDGDNPFSRISIAQYLPTVREAKKYFNLLFSDYKRLRSRFDKCYYNVGDFCLLELLKYKNPDLYYGLKANPKNYLEISNKGWNGPAYLPKAEAINVPPEIMPLLKALFGPANDLNDENVLVGIANKEYYPLYFEGSLNVRYLDGDEFERALKERMLSPKVGEWIDEGYSGVMGLLCAVSNGISRKDVFLSMVEYIWHQCEKEKVPRSLVQMAYGYDDKALKHGFRHVMGVIQKTPQINLLAFQHLSVIDANGEEEGGDSMEALIQESDRLPELMGIWLSVLKETKNRDYPFNEVRDNVEKIWKQLLDKADRIGVGTLDMIDVLGECSLEDTFEQMVLPLVTDNPQRWLGATVTRVKSDDMEYYFLKSKGIHALFGSLDKMYDAMGTVVSSAKEENKDYVMSYSRLFHQMLANIDDNYNNLTSIEVDKLPALSDSVLIGSGHVMPIRAAFDQFRETPFWKRKDLRIHRPLGRYYFNTEI